MSDPVKCPVAGCEWDDRGKQYGAGENRCRPAEGRAYPECRLRELVKALT